MKILKYGDIQKNLDKELFNSLKEDNELIITCSDKDILRGLKYMFEDSDGLSIIFKDLLIDIETDFDNNAIKFILKNKIPKSSILLCDMMYN